LSGLRGIINRLDQREERRHKIIVATFYASDDKQLHGSASKLLVDN
jgi:hypothetical protein